MSRRLASTVLVACASLALASCAVFAPAYDPVLDQTTTSAYGGVAKITADADLGLYADPATFSNAADQYATVTAALSVAAMRASTEPVMDKGTGPRSRDLLVSLINGCKAQVMALAGVHQKSGIKPGAGFTQPVMVSCDQAARAVGAMKGH